MVSVEGGGARRRCKVAARDTGQGSGEGSGEGEGEGSGQGSGEGSGQVACASAASGRAW